MPLYFKGLTIK